MNSHFTEKQKNAPTGPTYRTRPTGPTYRTHLPDPPTGPTYRTHLPNPPAEPTCHAAFTYIFLPTKPVLRFRFTSSGLLVSVFGPTSSPITRFSTTESKFDPNCTTTIDLPQKVWTKATVHNWHIAYIQVVF